MSRCLRTAAAVLSTLALAACAGIGTRQPLPPGAQVAAMERQVAREAALAAHDEWALAGRVALSNEGRGGSGRLDWRQHGDGFQFELAAPITRKGWRLAGEPGMARLEGLDGGPRAGTDAAALLRQATGWEIPVQALAHWVRGARAPGSEARLEFDAEGRLARLRQDGWVLEYSGWEQAAPELPWLPARITAERGSARVRLVVDAWSVQ